MTREFDKQRRDDSRPSFRKQSSDRQDEERSPRPARPRLNRETVDRAWESGAQQQHADYRPRNSNGQSPRNNRYNNQQSGYASSQNSRSGSRPYGNRQDNRQDNYRDKPYDNRNRQDNDRDNPRRSERNFSDNQGPRSQSFNRRRFDDQRSDDRRPNDRRGYSDRSGGPNSRQGFRDNASPQGRSPQFRDRDQGRGYPRRDFERDSRPSREFDRDTRPQRSSERDGGSFRSGQQGDTQHPRWQSRPPMGHERTPREREEFSRQPFNQPTSDERFEGDYERFDRTEAPHRPERPSDRPFRGSTGGNEVSQPQAEEHHVTRLPNGRVLKGPRPVQRRNAQFWTSVAEDAEGLIERVHTPSTNDEGTEHALDATETMEVPSTASEAGDTEEGKEAAVEEIKSTTPRKPRTRIASAVARDKKAVTAKPRSTGPKPSKRGFKWPTP